MAEFDGLVQMLVDLILIDEDEARALVSFHVAHREFRGQPNAMRTALNAEDGQVKKVWDVMGEGQQALTADILTSVGDQDMVLI